MGSLVVTLLLGFAFGRGVFFEFVPENNVVVLAANVEEAREVREVVETSQDTQPEADRPLDETPTLSPEEEVLGDVAELLTPLTTDTEIPTPTMTPTVTITATPSSSSTLKPTITNTPSAASTSLPTHTLTPTPSLALTSTPTPTQSPIITTSSLNTFDLINQYAGQYGVDAGLLRKIADCESHFNANAVGAGGLYVGMFQFGSGSWQSMRAQMGLNPNPELRKSGEESIKTAAFAISKGKASMWPNCSR